jgi:hypothetical protein
MFRRCTSCRKAYSRTTWGALPLVGFQLPPKENDDPDYHGLELRNCTSCKSTLATELTKSELAMVLAARRGALRDASRLASDFSMRKGRSIHPDVPWSEMSEAAQSAAHTTAQAIAMEILDL